MARIRITATIKITARVKERISRRIRIILEPIGNSEKERQIAAPFYLIEDESRIS
jgi:hypothetical protein